MSGPALEPSTGEELASLLREHSAARRRLLVRGGGSRTGISNLTDDMDAVLCTSGLSGVSELDDEEGVVEAGAGTLLSELAHAAEGTGWELPLDPPGARATLGGALAAAAAGPRWPSPRAAVLGLGIALATGERTRCGGRVVKNVTGYDLAKLHTGGFGSFGVIESAWLRLRPRAERVVVLTAAMPEADGGWSLSLEAARRPTARVAARLGSELVLELAGDAPAVQVDLDWCLSRLCAETSSPGAVERVRAFAGEDREAGASPDALHVRASVLPSAVQHASSVLTGLGAQVLVHLAQGLVYARVPLPAAPPLPEPVQRMLAGAAAAGLARVGFLRIEAAPAWAKRGRDVFGETAPTLPLLRALKREFDPQGILNPGRFAGAL